MKVAKSCKIKTQLVGLIYEGLHDTGLCFLLQLPSLLSDLFLLYVLHTMNLHEITFLVPKEFPLASKTLHVL